MTLSIAARWRYICLCSFLVLTRNNYVTSQSTITTDGIATADANLVPLDGPCKAMVKEFMSRIEKAELMCQTPKGMIYKVPNVDMEWIREKESTGELQSGTTMLDIPSDTMIDMESYTLQLSSPPGLLNP
jgi:hypothetical protein